MTAVAKISVHHIQWLDDSSEWMRNEYAGVDGIVFYKLDYPPISEHIESWMAQPFSARDVTATKSGSPVWSWNRDREAPTLGEGMPQGSYRCRDPSTGAHAHLHLRAGKIVLEGDGNVELA